MFQTEHRWKACLLSIQLPAGTLASPQVPFQLHFILLMFKSQSKKINQLNQSIYQSISHSLIERRQQSTKSPYSLHPFYVPNSQKTYHGKDKRKPDTTRVRSVTETALRLFLQLGFSCESFSCSFLVFPLLSASARPHDQGRFSLFKRQTLLRNLLASHFKTRQLTYLPMTHNSNWRTITQNHLT